MFSHSFANGGNNNCIPGSNRRNPVNPFTRATSVQ